MEPMCGERTINVNTEISRSLHENRLEVTVKKNIYNPSNFGGVKEDVTKNRLNFLLESHNITRKLCQKDCKTCLAMNEEYALPVVPGESLKAKTWVIGYMPTNNSSMIRVPFSDGMGLLFRDILESRNIFPYYTYVCKCCCVDTNKEMITDCMERYLLKELSIGQPHFLFCLDVPVVSMLTDHMTIIQKQSSSKVICNIEGISHPVTVFSIPDFTKVSNVPDDSIMRIRTEFEKILNTIIGGQS